MDTRIIHLLARKISGEATAAEKAELDQLLTRLVGRMTTAIVVFYGGWLAIDGKVSVGVLAAFLLYLRRFFEPMQELSQFYNLFQAAVAGLEKLSGVLEEPLTVAPPAAPIALAHLTTLALSRPRSSIGSKSAMSRAMMPMTTTSSMSENPSRRGADCFMCGRLPGGCKDLIKDEGRDLACSQARN